MANTHFNFKEFSLQQDKCAMKVTTDACLFGALVAKELKNHSWIQRALDIGTGTSLLAQMIAQQTNFPIYAIEIEKDAILQASENILQSKFSNRIHLLEGDIKTTQFAATFDLIFSNPPFYEADLKSPSTKKNVAHHDDSLTFEDLTVSIEKNLTINGICFLLIPFKRESELINCLLKNNLGVSKIFRVQPKPSSSFTRSIFFINRNTNTETVYENIQVYNEAGAYSKESIDLLTPYYLFL
jgi:tRNA1Val (adenine37-N6)-methyltransferase